VFDKNVFINCPFDEGYTPLLKALLFTIKKGGLSPRLALERWDSGEVRLNKIRELIELSQYSIHDLSRLKAKQADEYSRMNMPFELGLDYGCRIYHEEDRYKQKKFLLLEEEQYSTQKALSDLSFADCKCHKGKVENLVYAVRSWFVECNITMPSVTVIWDDYNFFCSDLYEQKAKERFSQQDIDRLPISEVLKYMDSYC